MTGGMQPAPAGRGIGSMVLVGVLAVFLAWSEVQATDAQGGTSSEPNPPELVLFTWAEYLDPALLEAFERRHGARVKQVYFATDDIRDDHLIKTGGAGFDLVLVAGYKVDLYRRYGWLAKVPEERLPNLRHIDPRWRNAFPSASEYAVPYAWGSIGIAYRKDLVSRPPSSWMDLFRPATGLKGKLFMIEDARDTIGLALKALGHSVNETDPQALQAAEQLLLAQKPFVKTWHYLSLTADSALVSGDLAMGMLYNGDALTLQEHDARIDFIIPQEGTALWVDYLAVLKSSRQQQLAWSFIDFLNEPENAARLAEYIYYATPNRAAEKLLSREFLENPVIYPPRRILEKSEFYEQLPPRASKRRNELFSRLMSPGEAAHK